MPREDIPEELVEKAARDMYAACQIGVCPPWESLLPDAQRRYRRWASAVLSAVSEAGWEPRWNVGATADEYRAVLRDCQARDHEFAEARAQAENLAEALDELLIGGADAVSMEHAKRAAKVVLRSYRKARDAT